MLKLFNLHILNHWDLLNLKKVNLILINSNQAKELSKLKKNEP